MKLRFLNLGLSLVACCALMVACGGGDDDKDQGSIEGRWTGSATGQIAVGGTTLTMDGATSLELFQDGNSVTGAWDGYSVSGTLNGQALSLTLAPFTMEDVRFTGSFSATFNGTEIVNLHGTLTGTKQGMSASAVVDVAKLTRSKNFEDLGVGIVEAVSAKIAGAVK